MIIDTKTQVNATIITSMFGESRVVVLILLKKPHASRCSDFNPNPKLSKLLYSEKMQSILPQSRKIYLKWSRDNTIQK